MIGRRRTLRDPHPGEWAALLARVRHRGSISESAAALEIPIELVSAWRRRDRELSRQLIVARDSFLDEKCRAIASLIREGSSVVDACRRVGITRSRLHVWRHKYRRVDREISRAQRASQGARP